MGLQITSPPTSPLHRPPPAISPLKRKLEDDDEVGDVLLSASTASEAKKRCVEVVGDGNTSDGEDMDADYNSDDQDSDTDSSSSRSSTNSASTEGDSAVGSSGSTSDCEDNKENAIEAVNKISTAVASDISLSKSEAATTSTEAPPKVIVEHQPLPSIYDLHQMSATCDNLEDGGPTTGASSSNHALLTASATTELSTAVSSKDLDEAGDGDGGADSGLSDEEDEEEEDEVSDLEGESDEEEEEDEEPSSSPLFDPVLRGTTSKPLMPTPPKAIYNNDRYWGQHQHQQQQQQSFGQQQQQQLQAGNGNAAAANSTFHFLEQTNQRIECAENGKSYLQLGTMNAHQTVSHHLPVTPVIQPKPNMVYRRPIPPFRSTAAGSSPNNQLLTPPAGAGGTTPRPVCDHSNCLTKRNSFCYRNLRSRMLNLSLGKLHVARQSHEGSLRRSVLICNMLRYIEDETEREAIVETNQFNTAAAAAPSPMATETSSPEPYWQNQAASGHQQQPPPPPPAGSQQQQACNRSYSSGLETTTLTYNTSPAQGQPGSGAQTSSQQQQPPSSFSMASRELEPYESTLKDFNSAFRSTPYSSPAHPGSDLDSGLGVGDEDRGINWSSVLSLSSQSELDPLNNNSFATETWPTSVPSSATPTSSLTSEATPPTTSPMAITTTTSSVLTELETTISTSTPPTSVASPPAVSATAPVVVATPPFDDIGWKLSADDVLKAFPNDENLFGTPS